MPSKAKQVGKIGGLGTEVRDSLHMLHDPFSDRTNQPKIPDGKINDSLGLSSTNVFELSAATTEVHMLLYAGCNSCLIAQNVEQQDALRNYYVPKISSSGESLIWIGADTTIPSVNDFTVASNQEYGMWRTVSTGLQLKLLNPAEEDDGWWEAVRISPDETATYWEMSTFENGLGAADRTNAGCLVPYGILNQYVGKPLSNDNTYSTGLLRDLHEVQFELHGRKDYHDFKLRRNGVRLEGGVYEVDTTANVANFTSAEDDVHELIQNFADESMDMIYLRFHTRAPATDVNPSRFHTHIVNNQEVHYPTGTVENRFHSKCTSVGAGTMSIHFQGRRSQQNAATFVNP